MDNKQKKLADHRVAAEHSRIEQSRDEEIRGDASDVPAPPLTEDGKYEIIGVRFRKSGKIYYFSPNGEQVSEEDPVIVETSRGIEYGITAVANKFVEPYQVVPPLRRLVRRATDEDIAHREENARREVDAYNICMDKIEEHRLEMKLIDVEYTFDNSKLLFFFSADGRVDFRELVKDLAGIFRTRIELRQINIRDEAKMLGGLGLCGRAFCCHTFLPDFMQVSIKMAKEQNLSLNMQKLSGACGRLMCCLRYEYDTYAEALRRLPKQDSVVITPDGEGIVSDVEPLSEKVKVRLNSAPNEVRVYPGNAVSNDLSANVTMEITADEYENDNEEPSVLDDEAGVVFLPDVNADNPPVNDTQAAEQQDNDEYQETAALQIPEIDEAEYNGNRRGDSRRQRSSRGGRAGRHNYSDKSRHNPGRAAAAKKADNTEQRTAETPARKKPNIRKPSDGASSESPAQNRRAEGDGGRQNEKSNQKGGRGRSSRRSGGGERRQNSSGERGRNKPSEPPASV